MIPSTANQLIKHHSFPSIAINLKRQINLSQNESNETSIFISTLCKKKKYRKDWRHSIYNFPLSLLASLLKPEEDARQWGKSFYSRVRLGQHRDIVSIYPSLSITEYPLSIFLFLSSLSLSLSTATPSWNRSILVPPCSIRSGTRVVPMVFHSRPSGSLLPTHSRY